MPKVKVRFLGLLRTREAEVTRELNLPTGATLSQAVETFLREIASEAGRALSFSQVLERHVVMLNGISVDRERLLTTDVMEGDNVTIFLPVSGG